MLPRTRIKMAMSPTQLNEQPGAFATMNNISNIDYVRNELAVKQAWKPEIDRVVEFEVTIPLPVRVGPVGPQVDELAGKYLPGGGSQVEMDVPRNDRMKYLKVISEEHIE